MSEKIIVSGVGCCLLELLYMDTESYAFLNYSSRQPMNPEIHFQMTVLYSMR